MAQPTQAQIELEIEQQGSPAVIFLQTSDFDKVVTAYASESRDELGSYVLAASGTTKIRLKNPSLVLDLSGSVVFP